MNHEMKRQDRRLEDSVTQQLLKQGEHGVLSLITPDGMPYGVPLNYILCDTKLLFHCAKEGLKLDCINNNPKACFTVIGDTLVIPKKFTTKYRSVIAFGKTKILTDKQDLKSAMMSLCEKYSMEAMDIAPNVIEKAIDKFVFISMEIEEVTGKGSY